MTTQAQPEWKERSARSVEASPSAYGGFSGQYIRGEFRPGRSSQTWEDRDPFTSKLLARLALADKRDLEDAYRSAAEAQIAWAQSRPAERGAIFLAAVRVLDSRREELLNWLIKEAGSTRQKATAELSFVRGNMLWASTLAYRTAGRILPIDIPGKESRVYRRPLGVIGVISPWNFPMVLSNRSIAPALALGNAVVVKPADDTPITGGLLLAKIYQEAGLPAGLLNIVVGEVSEIGDAFTLNPTPKLISFTGSTRVGKRIGELAMTGPQLKRVALELGGNSPLVVLEDADLDRALDAAIFGRFFHQGQICMSANRIIVDTTVYDEFTERFVARARALKVGDPNDADTAIGPLINKRQLDALMTRIGDAKRAGLRQVLGGEPRGQVVPPHVFVDVPNDSDFAQAEQFGPVAMLIRARDEADALRLANHTEYGLSSAVFTQNDERGVRFGLQVDAGMTHVNDSTVNDDSNNMFGGEKNSGLGRFGGDWVISEMTTDHWVTVQKQRAQYPF